MSTRRHAAAALGILAVTAAMLAGWGGDAQAQYFGRNKVQYETFNFKVLATEHFDVHYYPAEEAPARDVARMAERWYSRLARAFDHYPYRRKPIILYANHADFQQTNVLSGFLSEGTGGVTESLKNRLIIPLTTDYAATDHVLGHEMVHVFQYDIAQSKQDTLGFNLARIPLWAIEGMSEYFSVGREDAHTAMWLRDVLLHDKFPTIEQMAFDFRYFPYRFGHALWAYIAGEWGDETVNEIYRDAGHRGLGYGLSRWTGMDPDSLGLAWKQAVEEAYLPLMAGRDHPDSSGTRILARDLDSGNINLAPSISPDGTQVAFLSERDLFSVDLWLADANTGRVQHKVISSSTDPHFDALRFIDSAGSWSPDGTRLAAVVFSRGNNAIISVDARNGRIRRRITPKDIGGISNPAWSPDGRWLVFAGTSGGISDLYVLDTENTENLQPVQYTDDRYAELVPTWSPDGKTLAFLTDRGPGTDFENFTFEPLRIGLLDVETKEIRVLAPFPHANHYDPQFSSDGRSLYFRSDWDGFMDIYRVDLETEEIYRVTRISTGVIGITPLSPAISVARETGRLMYSVFVDGNYNILALTEEEAQGELMDLIGPEANAAFLPPLLPSGESMVDRYLEDPHTGLAMGDEFAVSRYKPRLQLDYIGASTAGIVVDRYGAGLGGAVSMYFSDMLGNHTVGAALAANGGIKDIGGQAFYFNQRHRWNWGAVIGHVPYLNYYTAIRDTVVGGSPAFVWDQIRERVFLDSGALITTYPFSTAKRFEAVGEFSHYTYDWEVDRIVTVDGYVVDQRTTDMPAPSGITLVQGSLALVGDNSFFGFASPIRGQRYRFEAGTTFGTLDFYTLRMDYRRYMFSNPLTVATRLYHVGRYGRDADDPRLNQLFVGYESLVRGYSSGSFRISECSTADARDCPEFNRLWGSKIAVANLELRVPLFGVPRYGLINFPYVPTELIGFVDGGVAWNEDTSPVWEFRRRSPERTPVFSAGMSARVNVLGALVMEIYYAYPFQRPDRSGLFGFLLSPGW